LKNHQRSCDKGKKRLSGALQKAKDIWVKKKRRRLEDLTDYGSNPDDGGMSAQDCTADVGDVFRAVTTGDIPSASEVRLFLWFRQYLDLTNHWRLLIQNLGMMVDIGEAHQRDVPSHIEVCLSRFLTVHHSFIYCVRMQETLVDESNLSLAERRHRRENRRLPT
jgi:hypothetical protein